LAPGRAGGCSHFEDGTGDFHGVNRFRQCHTRPRPSPKERGSAAAVNIWRPRRVELCSPRTAGRDRPSRSVYRCMFRLRSHTVSSAERVSFAR
jgi:hypothetical protein